MRLRFELMQLEIGMSTSRYLPASGTAGLARSFVSGNSRVPAPPPMITESTLLVLGDMREVPCVVAIRNPFVASVRLLKVPPAYVTQSAKQNLKPPHVRHHRLRRKKKRQD